MTATILWAAIATMAAAPTEPDPLFALGGDPAQGVLVNLSAGVRPFDPPDPARPTVVFVHGTNVLPRTTRFLMAQRFAEAVARREGARVNVLAWDWNAATVVSPRARVNWENDVQQGRSLAAALWRHALPPERTHLIGHSSGSIVVASAARTLLDGHGRAIYRLTFLDPASAYHAVLFDRLAAGSASGQVENYWAEGPGAYGRAAGRANVWDYRVDVDAPVVGAVFPPRSGHWNVVRWYLATVDDRSYPLGYNSSATALPAR